MNKLNHAALALTLVLAMPRIAPSQAVSMNDWAKLQVLPAGEKLSARLKNHCELAELVSPPRLAMAIVP